MNLPKKIVRNVWILTIFNISHLKKKIKVTLEGFQPSIPNGHLGLNQMCIAIPPQSHIYKKIPLYIFTDERGEIYY